MNINKTPIQTFCAQSTAEDADNGRRVAGGGRGRGRSRVSVRILGQGISLRVRTGPEAEGVAAAAFDLWGRLDVDGCQRRPLLYLLG